MKSFSHPAKNAAKRAAGRLVRALRREPDEAALRASGLRLGKGVYIGRGVTFDPGFPWLISIGDDTTISANVEVLVHDASMKSRVGYSLIAPVTIGSGVYVGLGAIVLPGVTIGDGSIVGAGSVVRHDVPSGMVAVGNPARVVGDVEAHAAKHRQGLEQRPVYEANGWTAGGGITSENMRSMRDALSDGHGYVE